MVIFSLVLLLVLCTCRSKRYTTETLALSQHHLQKVLCHDTLWQTLSLHLEEVTLEWPTDSIATGQGAFFRVHAEQVELGAQCQSRTEVQMVTRYHDTVAARQESVEGVPTKESSKKAGRAWLFLLLGTVVAIIGIGWRIGFRRARGLSR